MPTVRMHSTRLDFRIHNDIKTMIEKASQHLGLTVSAFILMPAIERAKNILKDINTIKLNEKEHTRFINALESPPEPNKNLKNLFKKYKNI